MKKRLMYFTYAVFPSGTCGGEATCLDMTTPLSLAFGGSHGVREQLARVAFGLFPDIRVIEAQNNFVQRERISGVELTHAIKP